MGCRPGPASSTKAAGREMGAAPEGPCAEARAASSTAAELCEGGDHPTPPPGLSCVSQGYREQSPNWETARTVPREIKHAEPRFTSFVCRAKKNIPAIPLSISPPRQTQKPRSAAHGSGGGGNGSVVVPLKLHPTGEAELGFGLQPFGEGAGAQPLQVRDNPGEVWLRACRRRGPGLDPSG